MPDVLLLALLLAAVAIGWWLGRRERRGPGPPATSPGLARDYFVGLNYLLNDQQDRAIETFIGALEVNSDTIETHLALGNLFRTRGEADRAVKIHQNLLARPTLTGDQEERVQLELSRDFLHLGLLDRAERLLQGLVKEGQDDELRQSAKRLLVDLLEREGEWQAALDVALPHLVRQHDDIRRAAAHWLCELADQERRSASPVLARRHLKQALATDARCVRANLLLAEMALDTGQYRQTLQRQALVLHGGRESRIHVPDLIQGQRSGRGRARRSRTAAAGSAPACPRSAPVHRGRRVAVRDRRVRR